jgi:hypothetical protein
MKISEGKKKDLILEYIIERERGSQPKSASSEEIQNDVLPESSIEDITILLKEIEMHNPELVKFYFGITTTYSTKIMFAKPFLKKGGFEKIENTEKTQNRKDAFDFKVSKFKYYTFWWFFAFALIGFGLSIYNFTNSLAEKKDTEAKDTKKEQNELVIKKAKTSLLDQKNLDSLHNPKVLNSVKTPDAELKPKIGINKKPKA